MTKNPNAKYSFNLKKKKDERKKATFNVVNVLS